MRLTITEVEHIARLAHLELTQEEKERFAGQLSAILDYAARLQQVPTGDTLPTASVLPPRSVLREDSAAPGLKTSEILENAPQAEANQFRVPPVLEISQ